MGSPDPLFACEGDMAQRMAAHPWAATPLGASETWSTSLRTAVAILLRTRYPMILAWGESLVMLYNDAFVPTLGSKHPRALGGLLPIEFGEVWDEIGAMQHSVLAGGPATWAEDLPLSIERGTGPEEAYFTFSYSHVPDEHDVGGVLAVLSVTTDKVVAARRLALLNELAAVSGQVTDPDGAIEALLEVLGDAKEELAGGALYRPIEDPGSAGDDFGESLALTRGFGDPCDGVLPDLVTGQEHPYLRAHVSRDLVTDQHLCPRRHGEAHAVVALPVRTDHDDPGAVLVLVPHPLRPFDDDHARFVRLVTDQVAQILTTATAWAREQARLDALAALDAAKTAFLSNVSHEFRTPLTLLLGPLEDVLTGRTESLDRDAVESVHQSAHRLLRMVNALLDVARIETDGLPSAPETVDLGPLTEDLVGPFEAAAGRTGLALDLRLDAGLGWVLVDPALWEKVTLNLVANAIKFTTEGSVEVVLARQAHDVVLRVRDTGAGIPPEEVDHVFERFHRVAAAGGRSVEGTGLGLALVADAARAMGGAATVTSALGVGSTFEVRVPLPKVAEHTPTVGSAEEDRAPVSGAVSAWARDTGQPLETTPGTTTAPPSASPSGRSILVVEDNPAMRARVSMLLGELGRVVTAPNGKVALEVLRSEHVDLVVTDVMMPELDGLGLLRAVRADEALRSTPVVVLSARAGPEAATGAIEAEADDYLVKPFTPEELVARCRTNLELAAYRASAAAARVRGTLLAGVSHDMQTPLAVISSTLELLADGEIDAADLPRMAHRARLRATQLTGLVTQFLDWSRLSMNEPLPIHLEPTDLRLLAKEVVVQYDLARTSGHVDGEVWCDARRTEQILHNLVGNAVKLRPSYVELRLAEDGDDVLVRVVDDGPGVSPEVLAHLFEAFGPSVGVSGNGLGLHISREAARAQGGDLALESTGPDGTVFALRLPRGARA